MRFVHHGEDTSGAVVLQAAAGVIGRDGRMGVVTKTIEGAKMQNQNLPRVIQLPKQILLHLEVCCSAAAHVACSKPPPPVRAGYSQDARFNIRSNINRSHRTASSHRFEHAPQGLQSERVGLVESVAHESILGV